jgi:hypothetical protein
VQRQRERARGDDGAELPVSWVTTGAWRTRNQTVTSRITLTNIAASPAPTSTRASTAKGKDVTTAKASWPRLIRANPPSSSNREP